METPTANYFYGTDTYGKPIEVAVRADEQFFWRTKRFNGYGMSWTKWEKMRSEEILSDFSGTPMIKWGWNELRGYYTEKKLRLPITGIAETR
jgi:hypothetical protein